MKKYLIFLLIFLIVITVFAVTYVDFTTYTEVDAAADITVTASKVNLTTVDTRKTESYVYKDYTAGYFSSDFTQWLTIHSDNTGTSNYMFFWMMANITDDGGYIYTSGSTQMLCLATFGTNLTLCEKLSSSYYPTSMTVSPPFTYYLILDRDEDIGDYGEMKCFVYSDAARTVPVDTLILTLQGKINYRYLYVYSSYNDNGTTYSWSGYTENLALDGIFPSPSSPKNIIVVN